MPALVVDLSGADIVDNHCHGLVVGELLKADPATFEARLTLTGQAYLTSNQDDLAAWRSIEALVGSNAYSLISRRWLCEFLHCAEDPESPRPRPRQRAARRPGRLYPAAARRPEHRRARGRRGLHPHAGRRR